MWLETGIKFPFDFVPINIFKILVLTPILKPGASNLQDNMSTVTQKQIGI